MRHRVLLASGCLAALTALALLGAAVAVRPPGVAADGARARDAANRALVVAFYRAASVVIAGGDPAPLANVLAPEFHDRAAGRGSHQDGEELVDRLLALHAANPDLRLGAETIAADEDLVIAHVRVSGATPAAFLGLRLDDDRQPWGPVDVFRVAGDRIVERWGPSLDPVPPAPLLRAALDPPSGTAPLLDVARLALPPAARHAAGVRHGPRILLAEAGVVTITTLSLPGARSTRSWSLAAGQHIQVPPGTDIVIENAASAPARLLDLALETPPHGRRHVPLPTATPEPAPARQPLADRLVVGLPARPVLTVGRAVLHPGERFDWTGAPGPVLVHVEAGSVDLAAVGAVPWIRPAPGDRSDGPFETTLDSGSVALVEAGTDVEIGTMPQRTATLLVLTLLPADLPSLPGDGPAS